MKLTTYATTFLLLFCGNAWANKDKTVVATVNGVKITKGEFEQAHSQNMMYVSRREVTKKKSLRNIINRVIGIQKAKKNKLQNDPLVKKKMEDVLYHAQISKDLEPELSKIKVSDKDVEKYYKENPEYRTAHILLRVRANPAEAEWKAALTKAKSIYKTLSKDPKKFAEQADKFSQSSTAKSGGDLGFQPAIRMAPEFYRAIRGKSNGYISPPVRTQFGYHIIKVVAKKKFSQIRKPMYKKIVYDLKRDKILDKYFANARKKASVKVHISLD